MTLLILVIIQFPNGNSIMLINFSRLGYIKQAKELSIVLMDI